MTALLLLSGESCSSLGGQTGEGESVPAKCSAQPAEMLSLDRVSSLGFSAKEIVAFSNGGTAPAVWPARSSEVQGQAPAEATLTWSLEPLSNDVRFVRQVWELGGEDADSRCPDRMEIDVRLQLTVESEMDSWSAEANAVLTATSASIAQLRANLPASAPLRQYQMTPERDDEEPVRLTVDLLFSPYGSVGSLELVTTYLFVPEGYDPDAKPSDDAPQVRPFQAEAFYPLAYYPRDNSCGDWNDDYGRWRYRSEIEVGLETSDRPLTAERIKELLEDEKELIWEDGQTTRLSTEATLTQSTACLRPSCRYCTQGDEDGLPQITVPIELLMKTNDGRLDGQYALTSQVFLEGSMGRVRSLSARVQESGLAPSQLESRSGLRGLTLEDDETGMFLLEMNVDGSTETTSGLILGGGGKASNLESRIARKGTW